jgi:hypothetical protein
MQAKYIMFTILLVSLIALTAGCTSTTTTSPTATPTVNVTATPTPLPVSPTPLPGHTVGGKMATPTPPPETLISGIVTIDGKPAANCFVSVLFNVKNGNLLDTAITDKDGRYAITTQNMELRDRTFTNVAIYKNQTKLYSDSNVYQLDGQPLNFALTS